jgi:uncharacterized membrane protein YqaE (UPF0057 family)
MKKISTLALVLLFTVMVMPSFAINLTMPSPVSSDSQRDSTAVIGKEKIDEALKEFKTLSKHDRKERIKDAKKAWKEYRADKKAGRAEGNTNTLLLVLIAILLPPLAVYLHEGEINTRFWISIILTLLFYFPGLIYALIIILSKD